MFNCSHTNNSCLLVQSVSVPTTQKVLLALFWNALPDGHLMTLNADNVWKSVSLQSLNADNV